MNMHGHHRRLPKCRAKGLGDDEAGSGVLGEYRMDDAKRCHRVEEVEHEENGIKVLKITCHLDTRSVGQ